MRLAFPTRSPGNERISRKRFNVDGDSGFEVILPIVFDLRLLANRLDPLVAPATWSEWRSRSRAKIRAWESGRSPSGWRSEISYTYHPLSVGTGCEIEPTFAVKAHRSISGKRSNVSLRLLPSRK